METDLARNVIDLTKPESCHFPDTGRQCIYWNNDTDGSCDHCGIEASLQAHITTDRPAVNPSDPVPFTRQHELMLTEIHSAFMAIASNIDNELMPMLKNSPLASMLGL